jgi:hypothetical protein
MAILKILIKLVFIMTKPPVSVKFVSFYADNNMNQKFICTVNLFKYMNKF